MTFARRLLAALSLAAAALLPPAARAIDDQTVTTSEDPEMAAATAQARATLDDFLALHDNPRAGTGAYRLKVRFAAPGNVTEHMWVTAFHATPEGFEGELADEPEYATDVKNGQTVRFSRDRISDWGYVDNGHQKGSFTVCVLFKRMPAAEVKQYREQYGFDC